MTDQSATFNNNSDELDLAALMVKGYLFIRKYFWLIAGGALTGLLCGIVLYFSLPKAYSSKLVVETTILSNAEEIALIENWDNLLNEDGYPILSKYFDCDPQILRRLNHIDAEPISKTGNENASGLAITILVKDTALIEPLQRAILHGLENNEYVSERVQTKRSNLLQLISSTQLELARLDSTKRDIDEILADKRRSSSSLMVNISDMNTQMVALREKLLTYQESLKFVNDIQVLQDFVKTNRPKQPRLSILVVSGFGAGLLIGLSLSLFRAFRAKYFPLPARP